MRECFFLIASITIGNPAWTDAMMPAAKDRWIVPNVGTCLSCRDADAPGVVAAAVSGGRGRFSAKFFTINPGECRLPQRIDLELAELPKIAEQEPIAATPAETKLLTVALATELTGEPQTSFSSDTPKLYLRWHGERLNAEDKVRCVWIAEDVGEAAPANYQVSETSTKASETGGFGSFTLSRPIKGWPIGKYRAEIYVGDKLAETIRFTIEKAGQ